MVLMVMMIYDLPHTCYVVAVVITDTGIVRVFICDIVGMTLLTC